MMITSCGRRINRLLLRLSSSTGQIRWRHEHSGIAIDLEFLAFAGASTVPARAGLATGRAFLVHSGGRQHVWPHHGASSDLALQIVGIVQIWECTGGLLGKGGQARQLAQHSLLALVQQLGLASQLLLPPGELLLSPLINGSSLLLGCRDSRLSLLSCRTLALLGLGQSLGTNAGGFGQIGLEALGRLAVVRGCLSEHRSRLLLRLVVGRLELRNGLLSLGCEFGSRLCSLTLNSPAQIFGVEIGILPGCLRLMIGLASNRLGLAAGGGNERVGLSLGLLDLGLNIFPQLGT